MRTVQQLRKNLGAFSDVDVSWDLRSLFDTRAYSRLTDDYRVLHALSRMFLQNETVSEKTGDITFNGFLLDMNNLFERFVSTAFVKAATLPLTVSLQEPGFLSNAPNVAVRILPDVMVRIGKSAVLIADAKYKRSIGKYENHDFYQMVAYGTASSCNRTVLVYPLTELESASAVHVLNSAITIEMKGIDLGSSRCVEEAEGRIKQLLASPEMRGGKGLSR